MLFYLDQLAVRGTVLRNCAARKGSRGLNENYGRELLELPHPGRGMAAIPRGRHEAARCFTGWTINQPQARRRLAFNRRMHDDGERPCSREDPAGGGIEDGEKVFDIVAHHPATRASLREN